jgi:hypothetical protein
MRSPTLDELRKERSKLIELAMTEGARAAQADGVSDPIEVRRRIMAARALMIEKLDATEAAIQAVNAHMRD